MKKNKILDIWNKYWLKYNEIEKILLKVTDLKKSRLFLCEEIDNKYYNKLNSCFNKFSKGEPIEYILYNAEFYLLDFYVDNRVLIPRNETELLVEKVLEEINIIDNNTTKYSLIDVWAWSSCINISILKNTININDYYALDISKEALEVSEINLKKYFLEKEVKLLQSDLLNVFFEKKQIYEYFLESNVIITANLPYIKNNDFDNMSKETYLYEPNIALFWWKDTWFELYEKLIFQIFKLKEKYKLKNIILFIEIWFDQKYICENFLHKLWLKYYYYKDNLWIDRCVKIYLF